MTTEHEASRTLVKSPPELWAECSDAGSLARHLGEFGEITITRLEPETTVAWEGEHVSGTVQIEPSGWGTRVTLTAQRRGEAAEAPSEAEAIEEPDSEAGPGPEPDGIGIEIQPDEENYETATDPVEDAHPVPVADTGPARARWRRLRALFRRRSEASTVPQEDPSGEAERSEALRVVEELCETPPPPPVRVPAAEPELEPEGKPAPVSQPELESTPESELDAEAILASALESLGQAHHRPFSRA